MRIKECTRWGEIQATLDTGENFGPELNSHLRHCADCSRKLAAYRRFLRLFAREVLPGRWVPARKRTPAGRRAVTVAALVLGVSAAVALLVLPSALRDAELRREYARELAGAAIEGDLFEYAARFEAGYQSSWF